LFVSEQNDNKLPSENKRWFVKYPGSNSRLWILPGSGDGFADTFSTKDVGARRYRSSEDQNWPFGAWGHLGYNEGEIIDSTDVVFWYVAHMKHLRSEGETMWHSVGPDLLIEP
jgi:hypothetical protein